MTLFEWLKLIHVSCAFISISGFALRGYWKLTGNPLLRHCLAKVLPHCVDTLLLGSAVGMLFVWQTSPLEHAWLMAKIIALLAYIFLGMACLRFGRTYSYSASAYGLALVSALYIVSVAYTKSATGFISLASG